MIANLLAGDLAICLALWVLYVTLRTRDTPTRPGRSRS